MGDDKEKYYTGRKIKEIVGVSSSTLRRWDLEGKIKTVRTIGGSRLYEINSLIKNTNKYIDKTNKREKICYCRVSSPKQLTDLKRQEEYMQSKFPDHIIISDVGSGINWKRKNFSKILEDSINGKVKEIVIAHKDRLCRFNFELLETIFRICKVDFIILDKQEYKSEEQELADDLLSIIHIFNCRQMGKRRYKTTKECNKNEKDKISTECISKKDTR